MASELNFDSFGFLDNVWDLNQTNWSDYFWPSIPDGVIAGIGSEMSVYANSSGMVVYVRSGECRVRSHRGALTAEKSLTIAAADATNPRYDLVVARVNYLTSTISIAVKTGTPSATPTAPSVTQSAGNTWEIPLARVTVAANAVTIAATSVMDLRNIIRAGGYVRNFSGTSLAVENSKEYRQADAINSLTISLPPMDSADVWMCSVNFTSSASFTSVSFLRFGISYSPKIVGDTLNLKSRRYNLSIWWDGSFFWVASKAV